MLPLSVCLSVFVRVFVNTQGGLTWLWLDAPYVITARKLFNWALEANDKGDTFPVSTAQPLRPFSLDSRASPSTSLAEPRR